MFIRPSLRPDRIFSFCRFADAIFPCADDIFPFADLASSLLRAPLDDINNANTNSSLFGPEGEGRRKVPHAQDRTGNE